MKYNIQLAGLGLHIVNTEATTEIGIVRYYVTTTGIVRRSSAIPASEVKVGDYMPITIQMASVWNGHREFSPVALSMTPPDIEDVVLVLDKALNGMPISPKFIETELDMKRSERPYTPIDIPVISYATTLNEYEEHRAAGTLNKISGKLRISNLLVRSLSLGSMCIMLAQLAATRGKHGIDIHDTTVRHIRSKNVSLLRSIQELFWLIGVRATVAHDKLQSYYELVVEYDIPVSGQRLGFRYAESPEAEQTVGGIIVPKPQPYEDMDDLIITPGVYPACVMAKVIKIETNNK